MINSTSSSDRTQRTDAQAPAAAKTPALRLGSDQFSASNSAALREALARQPALRPDVVARGRLLAADPGYPSLDVLRKVGAAIIASPDFSEDEA